MDEVSTQRPILYYIAILDCHDGEGSIENPQGFDEKGVDVYVTLDLRSGSDHISYEKQGVIKEDLFLLSVFFLLFGLTYLYLERFETTFENENAPNNYCLIAMTFHLMSLMCDLSHWYRYSLNGVGIITIDVLSTIFEMVADGMMSMLLLMLANGWMTHQLQQDEETDRVYIPLSIGIFLIHIFTGCLTFIDRDGYHKFHDFSGW